ncbi:hypothetical protein [Peptostreptococcus russellii]|nr:hypothetical protein [Peptostreptococcus russellii]
MYNEFIVKLNKRIRKKVATSDIKVINNCRREKEGYIYGQTVYI